MTLVEREEHLQFLEGLFVDCLDGAGAVVMIKGAAGTGKSHLLHTFARRCATEYGAVFLSAAAARAEGHRPLGVVQQLLRRAGLTPTAAEQANHLVRDAELALTLHDAGSDVAEVVAAPMLHRLCSILLDHAEQTPVLIGVDDANYGDPASLQCLLYVARRIGSARVMVILNQTTGPGAANPILDTDFASQPRCHQISLGRLSPAGTARLVEHELGPNTARQISGDLYATSGGSPLLATALIEDCRTGGQAGAPEFRVGDGFHRAVIALLYRCDPETRTVARVLAVLDEPVPLVLSRMAGLDTETTSRALRSLADAGLLAADRFRHPRSREAVLAGMSAEELAAMHGQAASLLRFAGSPASTVARHLVRSGRIDTPWHAQVLREAAEQAILEGDLDLAVGCLRLAYQQCTDDRQRATVRAVLAQIEWRIDPAAASVRHLTPLTVDIREERLAGSQAVATVYGLLWSGRPDDAVDVLNRLVERNSQDPEIIKEVHSARLWCRYLYPSHASSLTAGPQPAPASGSWGTDPVHTVLRTVLSGSTDNSTVAAAEALLQRVRLADSGIWPLAAAIQGLAFSDQLQAAAFWCDSLVNKSKTMRAPSWTALFTAMRAEIELRRGELPAAGDMARGALSLISRESWGVGIGLPLSTAIQAAIATGHYDLATGYLRVRTPPAMLETALGLHYLNARGAFYLATDRAHAALADFNTCGQLMSAWNLDLAALVPWRVNAARACLRLRQRQRAAALLHEQIDLLGSKATAARGKSLRLLASLSEGRARLGLLKEAVEVLKQSGDQLELAQAFADLSQALHNAGDTVRARLMLRAADEAAKQCHAQILPNAPRAEVEMEPAPVPDSPYRQPVQELSAAERRVAALAALGHTNREISQRLFITVSTVEQHLTRIYRKLGVTRRTDLPPALHLDLADSK